MDNTCVWHREHTTIRKTLARMTGKTPAPPPTDDERLDGLAKINADIPAEDWSALLTYREHDFVLLSSVLIEAAP